MLTRLEILENVDLAPVTTLRIGGPARYFAIARTRDDVRAALDFAQTRSLPLFVLGGGSNLLVADGGFEGVILHNRIAGIDEVTEGAKYGIGTVVFEVGAGEDWDRFVAGCVAAGLAGVECLSGIPGTVGATPIQNVGAYGQEVSETIASVECIDRFSGDVFHFENAGCSFGYRSSIFNSSSFGRFIVTSVRFALTHGRPKVVYKDLRERFADSDPDLPEVRAAVIAIRAAKSMVIDPFDPNARSAGSFFKNPIVSAEKLDELRASFDEVPGFAFGSGQHKIPAAWLIEAAGFTKGYTRGRAGISTRHSLALINRGGATAAEILVLRDEIVDRVAERFGVLLSQEPVMLGFDEDK
jgi:UDP-N-acetylmuramate dehydrogenase